MKQHVCWKCIWKSTWTWVFQGHESTCFIVCTFPGCETKQELLLS